MSGLCHRDTILDINNLEWVGLGFPRYQSPMVERIWWSQIITVATRKQERILEQAGKVMAHRPCLRDTCSPITCYLLPFTTSQCCSPVRSLSRNWSIQSSWDLSPETPEKKKMYFSSLGTSQPNQALRVLQEKDSQNVVWLLTEYS